MLIRYLPHLQRCIEREKMAAVLYTFISFVDNVKNGRNCALDFVCMPHIDWQKDMDNMSVD